MNPERARDDANHVGPSSESPPPVEILNETYERYYKALVAQAARLLRRRRIPEAEYSAEDSVQSGYRTLLTAIVKGKLNSFEGVEGCFGLLRREIARSVIAERDRRDAAKRGGPGIRRDEKSRPAVVLIADDLDLFDSGLPETDAQFISEEEVKRLTALLNPEQAKIVAMRLGALSNAVIARRLGVSERTVQRRLEEIRLVFKKNRESLS